MQMDYWIYDLVGGTDTVTVQFASGGWCKVIPPRMVNMALLSLDGL